MRLIDADALRDKLQEEIDKAIPPFDDVIGSIRCGVRLARNIVEDEPTVDAVPVRHGHWIDMDEQSYTWKVRCSVCGHERSMMSTQGKYPKYCEECGARMDEDNVE